MAFLRRKKTKQNRSSSPLLYARDTEAAISSDSSSPLESHEQLCQGLEPAQDPLPRTELTSSQQPNNSEMSDTNGPPEGFLDPALIGRTIKLFHANNWDQDIITTAPEETQILYENQRG